MDKCLGKDRNKDSCRNNQLDKSKFCKFHQYMDDYTEDMLNNLTLCSGCKKMHYMTEGKQCDKCKKRGEKDRIKNKNDVILCVKEGCTFKKSEENEYCGKHQQEYFKKQTELIGKKVCTNYIRGCRVQLEKNDIYSRCLGCREKVRVKNNVHVENEIIGKNNDIDGEIILDNKPIKSARNNKINIIDDDNTEITEENKMDNNDLMDNEEITMFDSSDITISIDESENSDNLKVGKNISSINKTYIVPEYIIGSTKLLYEIIEEFDNMGIDYPLANTLMGHNYKVNNIIKYIDATKKDGKFNLDKLKECTNEKCKKKMPEHAYIDKFNRIVNQCLVCRLHAQIKSKRQTRINSKTLWKEENHGKCAKYWLDARGRQIENKGIEKYLEDNAESAKVWRDKNPEKCLEANEKKKANIKIHYGNYVRDAGIKNINFELTFEEFVKIVTSPCFYCGIIQDNGFNGIDKEKFDKGYVKENSLSCCSMCNVMKGTLNSNVFLKRVEHILTYQGYIEGKLYPECFANHMNIIYNRYKERAIKSLEINFEITEEQFYELILNDCYICGKKTNNEHINGIDRIDNNQGYTIDNIESCCGECNYMKNKFNLNIFFDKLRKIKKYKLTQYDIKNSEFKYQHRVKQQKYLFNQKIINNTEELKSKIREKQRLNKQKYRENLKGIQFENEKNIIDNISKAVHLNKKTQEQLKEEGRIRQQIHREKLRENYGDEEYKKKHALQIAEVRKKKKDNVDNI